MVREVKFQIRMEVFQQISIHGFSLYVSVVSTSSFSIFEDLDLS
jgi:hypothetical protein